MNTSAKICVIDDEPLLLAMTVRLLVSAGYEVYQAATGKEGYDLVKKEKPDIVVLDVVLPDINGLDVCKAIKADPDCLGIFIMLISADYTNPASAAQGLNSGADEAVPRPFDNREFLARIKTLLRLKQTEDSLRKNEEQMRVITDNLPMLISYLSPQLQYQFVNKQYENWEGVPLDQIRGKYLNDFISADSFAQLQPSIETALSGVLVKHEHKEQRKGVSVDISSTIIPHLDSDGKVIGLFASVEDITERKKIDAELLRGQRLESLGTLAGGIAHDFNNMLGAVFGYMELAQEQCEVDSPIYAYLGKARKAFLRAKQLTSQLLTFAKGGISVKKVFVVNDNIRDWCALAISGSPISCEFILKKSLPPIDADMDQISQIMNNLVINARQAMPNGGNLTIRTYSRIVNDAHPQKIEAGSYVAIEVQDTGIGIPDQILPVIFEPFFTTKIGSSGLGLATSLSIANKHGGCIEVVSVPGSGSTVTVLIPVAVPDISGTDHTKNFVLSAQNTPTTSAQKKQSVLVMDDDEFIREMAVQILNDAGYRAAGTKNGEETIAAYLKAQNNSNPFDMVILDQTIVGGMGGEETIAKLLKVNPEICAIVSSGYSNSLILSNPKKYGFCAVVSKPYHKLELIEAVNKVLKKRAKSN